jgi:hypothetical protein
MESLMDKGYRVTGPVYNLTASLVANATMIYRVSNFAQQIGTKSFKPRKIKVMNNAGGNLVLMLGTGAAGTWVTKLPGIYVLNNMDGVWQEFDLPTVEFFVDMTAYPATLVAAGTVDVQVEVEEIG